MDEIPCGEFGCDQTATTENVVEMANLTGGVLAGIYPHERTYTCPHGHRTTIREELTHLRDKLEGKHDSDN